MFSPPLVCWVLGQPLETTQLHNTVRLRSGYVRSPIQKYLVLLKSHALVQIRVSFYRIIQHWILILIEG